MMKPQSLALLFAIFNLLLVLLFPPYDYVSLQRGDVATFDGFYFFFGAHPNRTLNGNFLALEILVLAVNTAIAWLLLRPHPVATKQAGLAGNRHQRAVLGLLGANLVAMLLFPPFENFAAISKAALPTFEGFFFIFGDNSNRQLVAPILYLEVALALINGGLLWLLFRDKSDGEIGAADKRAMAQRLQSVQKS